MPFVKHVDKQESINSDVYPKFSKMRDIIFLILFSIFVAIICITQIINTIHNLRKNTDIQYPQSPREHLRMSRKHEGIHPSYVSIPQSHDKFR